MSSPKDARLEARQTLFKEGIEIRRQVTGADHVERSWANVSDFSRPMQELATEAGWGLIWGRPGLDRHTRSLLNLAMLLALGKSTELGVHVKGALNNGCSEIEIQETLLQASIYAGLPAGLEGFRVAQRVLDEVKEERSKKGDK
ncbi:4-carboxymuconolactone decarboxylase [Pseudomassariella vexata]|uniref:4-carboxymuconolactone decarboxylase n=1 Tax=Pseudomassariella vexata TaxID=1141098 RepID=A0A1Y2DQW9_9PEZI|nr:4-carboxymuconolactone decarboxylase [Pseudomassariella vexata]ORY61683.1 4-carboxymuconolactone decarboxylase [Pseudomassariella vexata]